MLLFRPLQGADEVWDALVPSLACAAAYAGELEALQVLVELVGLSPTLEKQPGHTGPGGGLDRLSWGLLPSLRSTGPRGSACCPFPVASLALPALSRWVTGPCVPQEQ